MRSSSPSIFAAAACGFFIFAHSALSQGTAFTYQGRLLDNGAPANGSYDLKFTLFDNTAPGDFAGPITNSAVAVSNGLFTALIDLGPRVFNGNSNHFLEMAVRPAGSGSFTTLSPRQHVTPAPYAIHAATATDLIEGAVRSLNDLQGDVNLAAGANVIITEDPGKTLTISAPAVGAGPWQVRGTNAFFSGGNVGIGNSLPDRPLAISGSGPAQEWISFVVGGTTRWHINDRNLGWNLSETGVTDGRFFVAKGGNVGIGTESPAAKLQVLGDILLGANRSLHVPAAEEKLRIIRGSISAAGGVLEGLGFTVIHSGTGDYFIQFNTPFLSKPTLTTSAEFPSGTNPGRTAMPDNTTTSGSSVVITFTGANGGSFLSDAAFHFIAVGPR